MITREEREKLHSWDFPKNTLGVDCDKTPIMSGDTVEVVVGENWRKGDPDYSFCSTGKRGRIVRKDGSKHVNAISWTLIVEFPTDEGPETVGCTDIHLRKVQ